ncbi:MAG: phBC6A51 family helix-turn-helix protein [Candidatus Hodarchaeales archaeon]
MPKQAKKERIEKWEEFEKFVRWMALPSPVREPQTQLELAKELGVDFTTLSRWKRVEGFWEEVGKIRKEWGRERTPTVILGLYKKAIAEGNAAEVKLWLKYFEDWDEKQVVKLEGEIERKLNKEDRKLLEKALEYAGLRKDKTEDNK